LLLRKNELIHKPVLTNHDALLVYDVIEFTIIFLKDVILIIFILFIVLEIVLTSSPTIVTLYVVSFLPILTIEHV